MALSAVYVFQANTTLQAAQLNAMNNNILQNPIALVSPTTGAINFNLLNHVNLPITALSATSGSTGQVLTYVAGVPTWSSGALSLTQGVGPRVSGLVGAVTSSQNGGFAFDQATLVSANQAQSFQVTATSSFTVNAATAGPAAGGRDQAAAFASAAVHAYVITTGLNSTAPAGILSSVPPPTGPTMPTSYVAFAYLCSMPWVVGSTEFIGPTIMRGPWVHFTSYQALLSTASAFTTTPQTASLATFIPLNAQEVKLQVTNRVQSSAVNAMLDGYLVIQSTTNQDHARVRAGVTAFGNIECPGIASAEVTIPHSTGQAFNYYHQFLTTGSGAIVYSGVVDIRGYRVANGG